MPLLVLLALIIGIPTLDVWLIFQVGHQIGALPTLAVLIVEAVIGGLLMRHEGRRAWSALNDAFNSGRMPTGELADAALVLVGGVLLMLPGFATDLIGFLFLLPITRPYARRILAFFVARRISRLAGTYEPQRPRRYGPARAPGMADAPEAQLPVSSSRARSPTHRRRPRPRGRPRPTGARSPTPAKRIERGRFQLKDRRPVQSFRGSDPANLCRPRTGLSGLLRARSRAVHRAELTRPQQVETLRKQIFQLGNRATLPQHVPVRTDRLLFLVRRPLTVRAQRLRPAARAFPQRWDLGLGREHKAELVLPRTVVSDLLAWRELDSRLVFETLGPETSSLQ